jgi:hypothetical protein
MVQQLLRVVKVLALHHKKATKPNSANKDRVIVQCDMLDRVGDILHQISRSSLQTIHLQTLLIRNKYLRQFKAADIKTEEQLRMRNASLFSSQVLPTQACLTALENTKTTYSLNREDAISISLSKLSQTLGSSGKGGPPVNPNKGHNNSGGGGGGGGRANSRQRNKSGGGNWGRGRNRSQSTKRTSNYVPQNKDSGYQSGSNKGYQGQNQNNNNNPGYNKGPKGRGRGRGRGGPQGF